MLVKRKKIFFKITIFIIFFLILYYVIVLNSNKININSFNLYFKYQNYERDIITTKIKLKAGWELSGEQPYFINGIIVFYFFIQPHK